MPWTFWHRQLVNWLAVVFEKTITIDYPVTFRQKQNGTWI